MMTPHQALEAAMQLVLDAAGDGYTLANYVVIMGLERVQADDIVSASWILPAPNQPHWITSGLLLEADSMVAPVDDA